jgi:hypothetical protein
METNSSFLFLSLIQILKYMIFVYLSFIQLTMTTDLLCEQHFPRPPVKMIMCRTSIVSVPFGHWYFLFPSHLSEIPLILKVQFNFSSLKRQTFLHALPPTAIIKRGLFWTFLDCRGLKGSTGLSYPGW